MPRRSRTLLGWPVLAIAAYACAVYEPPSSANGGSAGNAGGGGAGNPLGGSAGAPSSGGVAGMAGHDGGAAGESGGAGGLDPSAGGGGEGGLGGHGGGGNEGGAPPSCGSAAPEASCTCALHAGREYWFCTTFLGFSAAEASCAARGMHLPKVETQQEDAWLFATSADKAMGEYYLGASDEAVPNTWVWLQGGTFWQGVANGTATGYTHWSPNEPNDSGDCLVVQSNGPWDDRTCGDQRKYVCEAAP